MISVGPRMAATDLTTERRPRPSAGTSYEPGNRFHSSDDVVAVVSTGSTGEKGSTGGGLIS